MVSMKSVKRAGRSVVRIGVPVVLAFLVAGCGGGGGSSSTSSTSSATAVAVTTTNSPQVAGAGYNATNSATGTGSTGSSILPLALVGGGGALPSLGAFVQQQIGEIQSLNATGEVSTAVVGVTTSTSLPCVSGSGSLSITGGTTFGAGDTLAVTFNNCVLTTGGYAINGSFQFTLSTLTGTITSGGNWTAGGTFTFTNLTLTAGSTTETVSGGFTFNETSSSTGTTSTLTGTSLTMQQTSGTSLTLSGFNLTATDDTGTGETSFYGSGQVTDSALNGYVNFNISSTTPLAQLSGESYPSSGTMTITGANNTSVVLTAIDSTSVQLQEDTTGNGTSDNTVTEAWTSLG